MATLKITKKHHKHLNNPFPPTPSSLPFIHGSLLFNSQTLPSHQTYPIGNDFELSWSSNNGGYFSIYHLSHPAKHIWSTVPGQAFVSAALAETEVEESRGSFVVKDGDVHLVFAANLISYRAGGDWSTTYAPSPFYMTSKMKSLYLEGYDYSIFDMTKHDKVQIQIHGNSVQGRILHGNSPAELIETFSKSIGRPPELPEWIISGAIVGMQGGTEMVRHTWDELRKYDVPVSAFWLQEASSKGLPVCRHLFIHYPDDEYVHSFTYQQFLIGTEILVVPVLDKGQKHVKAYFPIGETCTWQHIWTGELFTNRGFEARVEAPIGYPAEATT